VKTVEGGTEEQTKHFFGYKAHVSMNAENVLITSMAVSTGEAFDGHHFCPLVDHNLKQQLSMKTYTGDNCHWFKKMVVKCKSPIPL